MAASRSIKFVLLTLVFSALVLFQLRFGAVAFAATSDYAEDASNATSPWVTTNDQVDTALPNNPDKGQGVIRTNKKSTPLSAHDHIVLQFRKDKDKGRLLPASIPVYIFPFQDPTQKSLSPDMIHIESNGVEESSVFTLASDATRTFDPNTVWLTDVKFQDSIWCRRFTKKVLLAQGRRRNASLPLQWPVFVVDFTDERKFHRCPALEQALGLDFIFYSKRSVVVDRYFNEEDNWVLLGQKVLENDNVKYDQMPLIVRTDIVQATQQILQDQYNVRLQDPIEKLWNRSVDLAHYWPSDGKSGIRQFNNALRDHVSRVLEDKLSSWNIFCGITGTADRLGRRTPQSAYVQAMLNTKIVVVTQRDEWEDHFRLYEALLSGALVMTDQMVTVPDIGLKNGTSVVEFNSAENLISLANHYLTHEEERQSIASAGRFIALSRHRSWHRMEEIILGSVVTEFPVSASGPFPYIVHANESAT